MSSAPYSQAVDLSQPRSRGELVEGLRQRLGHSGPSDAAEQSAVFSCGVTAVDRLLPSCGWRGEQGRTAEQQNSRAAEGTNRMLTTALLLFRSAALRR
jgi:hypothetical protein